MTQTYIPVTQRKYRFFQYKSGHLKVSSEIYYAVSQKDKIGAKRMSLERVIEMLKKYGYKKAAEK